MPLELAAEICAAYIRCMVLCSSRGRPPNAPAALIHPCQPIVAKQPPTGPGWAHELKHNGYRLQSHCATDGCGSTRSMAPTGRSANPLITEAAAKIDGSVILDAEIVWLDLEGVPNFDALHSRVNDQNATACTFDLLMLDGDDLRRNPYVECKRALRKLLRHGRGIQYVEHAEGLATNYMLPPANSAWRVSFQRS